MNDELRKDIARYVEESERTIREEEGKCRVLKEEVQTFGATIRNLREEVQSLKETLLRQQAMLHEWKVNDKVQIRKTKRHDTYSKKLLVKAFGRSECCVDSPLYHAVLGFMKGSQLQNQSVRRKDDWTEHEVTKLERRCMDKGRKTILAQMVTHMYDGEIMRDIDCALLKKKRFCTVTLARVSDMTSMFTASAVGCIAKCEGGKVKGEIGLLCGESTLRRTMDLVHDQAVQLGFSFMPSKEQGKVWCWGEGDNCILTKAINLYVKAIYCDACCDGVSKANPFILPLSGDLVRTSTRGKVVTVMGPKQSDTRLVNQERTGKSMCQSSALYTPAVAGLATEGELMGYFDCMVKEFQKIETQGFCTVNGKEWEVHIKVVVVADLSFLHKYVKRGGSSHSATCFCMLCSAFRDFRHEGYAGGCRRCRTAGKAYGADGLQICRHHEVCTDEFLTWQNGRYAQLRVLVPAIPLTKLPTWTTVAELRQECMERCVGVHACELETIARKSGTGTYTGQHLTDWILSYCRGGCTLSNDTMTGVMFCDIGIVKKCLLERNHSVAGCVNHQTLRLQMQQILQLEDEYAKMTLCMKDERFRQEHPSAHGIPIERLIICILHCPMRTHEKVLTMLMQQACMHRLPKKSKPILDEIAGIIRRIGNLPDTWSYKMDESNTSSVAKIKMHFDQSKRVFTDDNLGDFINIVRLAIPCHNRANWMLFIREYIKCIELMTVSRDYTDADLLLLELHCDTTHRLLIAHCGGKAAVTNYFHYIGSGHVLWMCRMYGNIWRYRNEGVEAFNKTLSKRCNMFNSAGNKGNLSKSGKVEPFEVIGKWLGRYVMWQLQFAINLFIGHGGVLGPTEISWDSTTSSFIPKEDIYMGAEVDEDDDYECTSDCSDTDSDLDALPTREELALCDALSDGMDRITPRKRRYN
jgi:hypothetical protein